MKKITLDITDYMMHDLEVFLSKHLLIHGTVEMLAADLIGIGLRYMTKTDDWVSQIKSILDTESITEYGGGTRIDIQLKTPVTLIGSELNRINHMIDRTFYGRVNIDWRDPYTLELTILGVE